DRPDGEEVSAAHHEPNSQAGAGASYATGHGSLGADIRSHGGRFVVGRAPELLPAGAVRIHLLPVPPSHHVRGHQEGPRPRRTRAIAQERRTLPRVPDPHRGDLDRHCRATWRFPLSRDRSASTAHTVAFHGALPLLHEPEHFAARVGGRVDRARSGTRRPL
ncbi:MAG: hypothetical protein AVDCRST_MAG01-01-226, partial [uncultured Rubrobacteraceae bacterium]